MGATETFAGVPNLDRLVAEGRQVKCELGRPMLDTIADLTWRLNQQAVRAAGGILPAPHQRHYAELTDSERAGMRSAVERVLTALVLLDIIDQPKNEGA